VKLSLRKTSSTEYVHPLLPKKLKQMCLFCFPCLQVGTATCHPFWCWFFRCKSL